MSIYEKISDNLYRLNSELSIRFNVVLNTKDSNNQRRYYAQIYEYSSSKYNTISNLRTINRDYSYHIAFKDYANKDNVIIMKEEHVYLLRKGLKEVLAWFNDKKYSNLYTRENNKLKLNNKVRYEPVTVLCAYGNKIVFEPSVVYNYIGDVNFGVRLTMNNTYEHEIEINHIYGLYETLRNLSMPNLAVSMLNSIPMETDNVHQLGSYYNNPIASFDTVGKANVKPKSKKFKSVFDL